MSCQVVLHHNDQDGQFSAALAYLHGWSDAYFEAVQYGQEPCWNRLNNETELLIVDFAFPRATLDKLASIVKSIVVIDHHAPMQKELEGLDYVFFDPDKSGCILTAEYLISNDGGKQYPILAFIDDYDRYAEQLSISQEIHYGVEFHTSGRGLGGYVEILKHGKQVKKCYKAGMVIKSHTDKFLGYMKKSWVKLDRTPIPAERRPKDQILPLTVAVFNDRRYKNELSHLCYNDERWGIDFAVCYFISTEGKIVFSLRSKKGHFDVAKVAKRMGGGGHESAASFSLPFDEGQKLIKSFYDPSTSNDVVGKFWLG